MASVLWLGLLCMISSTIAFNLARFDETILENCIQRLSNPQNRGSSYSRTSSNTFQLPSSSLESFISMVEKIEEKHPEWNLYQISKILLERFGYDGIYLATQDGKLVAKQEPSYAMRRAIIEKLLGIQKGDNGIPFDERDLGEEEKCSMYFMLGHLVNTTVREGIDEPFHVQNPQNPGDTTKTVAKHPREQGVVSLRSNEIQAIAMGKVLLGVVASENIQSPMIGALFKEFKEYLKEYDVKQIDTLIGVTIADVVALTAANRKEGYRYFGSGGIWNNTVCATDYLLHDMAPGCTLATLRGAIDGYLVGKALANLRGSNGQDLTLSKVLRMYYDPRGIVGDDPSKPVGYCFRRDVLIVNGLNKQMESSEGFYHLYNALATQQGRFDDNAGGVITAVFNELRTEQVLGLMLPQDGFCNSGNEDRCETSSDVLVILDDSDKGTKGFEYQAKIINKLSTYLDVGLGAGSIGVYFNAKDSGKGTLQSVIHNASNRADAACQTSWVPDSEIPASSDEESLMNCLNDTLRNIELTTSENSHSKSKAVVLFKYGELKMTDEARVERATTRVQNSHRDVRIFSVGINDAILTLLSTDKLDILIDNERDDEMASELSKRICNVPSVFQFDRCWDYTQGNEKDNIYNGYVTPEYTQYWAMYPEYFLKSYHIHYEFEPEGDNGELDVCFSRFEQNPRLGTPKQNTECQTSKTSDRKLTFEMKNPCQGYNQENCPPAYFSVTGKKPTGSKSSRCKDPSCRRTDQIKFKFSHKGVSCNNCLMLHASPIILFISVFFYSFLY